MPERQVRRRTKRLLKLRQRKSSGVEETRQIYGRRVETRFK